MDCTKPTATGAGILRPELLASTASLERLACGGRLGRWVENFWSVRWDLPEGTVRRNQTLPHPACTLSVERGDTSRPLQAPVVVTGVVTRRFDVALAGAGRVAAAKFRPGGLAALTGCSARALRDRVVPAATILPHHLVGPLAAIDAAAPLASFADGFRAALEQLPAPDDRRYDQLIDVITDALGDCSLQRVAQLQQRHGLSERALQRLFDHYVGVGPKWVLARYRMHDAVTDIDAGWDGSMADLAASLGWYDQAHFTRDFVALVGVTPGAYRARSR